MSRQILSDFDEKALSKVASRKVEGVKKDSNKAQRRWRLLARALTRSPELPLEIEDEISVRRFTSFELIKPALIDNTLADPDSTWHDYRTVIDREIFFVEIRRINKTSFTANELMGFNNTGNVCVWPSEECLAYYLLNNRDICRNKMVLELGGGMSCLAGVYVAKYCGPAGVTLTDGNVTSVDNVRCIVARNNMADFVKCGVVQWARAAAVLRRDNNANNLTCNRIQTRCTESIDESRRTEGLYDVILSADCLFFDDARLDLIETIYGWLADNGVALLMAPRRGTTFQKFAEAAVKRGFIASITDRYDAKVWSRHVELVEHGQEADYWKSQTRKFCDFCKCWIADNKPSIEFHEGGKKHKENVSKRLKEIHKNSAKEAKKSRKFEDDIKKMENAAMAAYMKDVESNNVDLTAEKIIREKFNGSEKIEPADNPNQMPSATAETVPRFSKNRNFRDHPSDGDYCDPYSQAKRNHQRAKFASQEVPTTSGGTESRTQGKSNKVAREKRKGRRPGAEESATKPYSQKLWYEARTLEGYTYYWHIETNESVWETPAEGYMSIAEQEEEAKEEAIQAEFFDQIEQESAKEKAELLEEQRANAEREKLKALRKRNVGTRKKSDQVETGTETAGRTPEETPGADEDSEPEEKMPYRRDYSVPEKPEPYGPWQTVEVVPKKSVDLQLPKKKTPPAVPSLQNTDRQSGKRIFAEKTITQLSSSDSDDERKPAIFKKRKFGMKKAVRKRFSED